MFLEQIKAPHIIGKDGVHINEKTLMEILLERSINALEYMYDFGGKHGSGSPEYSMLYMDTNQYYRNPQDSSLIVYKAIDEIEYRRTHDLWKRIKRWFK